MSKKTKHELLGCPMVPDFAGNNSNAYPPGVSDQSMAIRAVCSEMGDFLVGKNESYNGAVFNDVVFNGKTIGAADTINVRITDKIRRLMSGKVYEGDDDEKDLLGYLILKQALKKLND